jgi:hypothetical protein
MVTEGSATCFGFALSDAVVLILLFPVHPAPEGSSKSNFMVTEGFAMSETFG